jgi:hypothetical protein
VERFRGVLEEKNVAWLGALFREIICLAARNAPKNVKKYTTEAMKKG